MSIRTALFLMLVGFGLAGLGMSQPPASALLATPLFDGICDTGQVEICDPPPSTTCYTPEPNCDTTQSCSPQEGPKCKVAHSGVLSWCECEEGGMTGACTTITNSSTNHVGCYSDSCLDGEQQIRCRRVKKFEWVSEGKIHTLYECQCPN